MLWIGAVLCFFAYGIQSAKDDNPQRDNVSEQSVGKTSATLFVVCQYYVLINKVIYYAVN